MDIKGLDVQGLDILQISKKMEVHLTEHFTGHTLINDTNGIFQESYRLAHEEIDHLLIQPEGVQLYNGDEWFCGASGIVELTNISNGEKETYTVMLVLDEPQSKALYLYVSKWNATTQSDVDTLVKNFTQGNESVIYSIEITETLSKTITLEATDSDEALDMVKKSYDNADIIIDAESFVGVDFTIVEPPKN